MSLFDDCAVKVLTKVNRKVCAFNIGQGQKLAFWLASQTPFTATSIITAAAWAAATEPADPETSPVVVSNTLNNFAIAQSERVENTADTNANAMPELLRGGNVMASATLRSVSPAELAAMQSLIPFSQIDVGDSDLAGVIINSENEVIYNKNDASLGFPIYTLFAGDPGITATLGANSEAPLNFMLKAGWFKDAEKKAFAFDFLRTYPAVAV